MIIMKIDKNKLPIKYHLNIQYVLENYPTEEDLIYELASDIDFGDDVELNIKEIKYIFEHKKFSIKEVEHICNSFVDKGYLQKNKETNKYKLIDHPWR